jgi:hypothetical protein
MRSGKITRLVLILFLECVMRSSIKYSMCGHLYLEKAPCGQKNEDTIAVVRIPCGDIFLQGTMGMEEFRRHDV